MQGEQIFQTNDYFSYPYSKAMTIQPYSKKGRQHFQLNIIIRQNFYFKNDIQLKLQRIETLVLLSRISTKK
jgi:hypothetical protein